MNIAVFVPLSLLSQRLSDASVAVREDAFHAAFQVVDGDTAWRRRALLLVVLEAARPARLSCKGLGPLSLAGAADALRAWYSFTNVLVNVARPS